MRLGFGLDEFFVTIGRYASIQGRASRTEFWTFQLYYWGSILLLAFLVAMLGVATAGAATFGLGLIYLGLAIPSFCVGVRRLHDTDTSGWFTLIGIVPFLGSLILLIYMCLPSKAGPNRFGPPSV